MSYDSVVAGIQAAVSAAGRTENSVTLIAVTKYQDVPAIEGLIDRGHRVFGENRVQDAVRKFTPLKARTADISVHLIGQLQTNKAEGAVAFFDCIHSLDRASLARTLAAAMQKQNRRVPCFIQVNTGREPQKGGVFPEDLDGFMRLCRDDLQLPVIGLMCIPPADVDPAPHFRLLADAARQHGLPNLSMGMTADYATAITAGATHVRVGSGLFI